MYNICKHIRHLGDIDASHLRAHLDLVHDTCNGTNSSDKGDCRNLHMNLDLMMQSLLQQLQRLTTSGLRT